jgi:hypothetical protein
MKSSFLLQDGRLSIDQIMQFELPHAVLAFLSACQTAKGDANVPDQAVHLAGALTYGFERNMRRSVDEHCQRGRAIEQIKPAAGPDTRHCLLVVVVRLEREREGQCVEPAWARLRKSRHVRGPQMLHALDHERLQSGEQQQTCDHRIPVLVADRDRGDKTQVRARTGPGRPKRGQAMYHARP